MSIFWGTMLDIFIDWITLDVVQSRFIELSNAQRGIVFSISLIVAAGRTHAMCVCGPLITDAFVVMLNPSPTADIVVPDLRGTLTSFYNILIMNSLDLKLPSYYAARLQSEDLACHR